MNTAMRIAQIAADNEVATVFAGNDRMAIEALADELLVDVSDALKNDDMVLDEIEAVLAEGV